MGMLLIGLAITLLDFPLQLAGSRAIDLAPDVLGYLIVMFGLRKISTYSRKFFSAHKLATFAAIASGVVLGAHLLIGSNSMSFVFILTGIAELILQVALMFIIASGLHEIEEDYSLTLHSKWLKISALGVGCGILLGYAGLLFPALVTVGSLIMDVLQFVYLILVYLVWEAFKTWKATEEE